MTIKSLFSLTMKIYLDYPLCDISCKQTHMKLNFLLNLFLQSANNNLGPDNHPMEPLIGANHHAKETNNDNGKLETAPPTPNAIIATTAAEQQQQPPHIIDEIEKNDEKSKITKTITNHNPLLSNGSTIKDHNNSKSPIMTSLTILTSSPPKDNHAATEDTAKEKDGGGDDGDVAISEYIIKSSSCQ